MKHTLFLSFLVFASLAHGETHSGPLQPVLQSLVDKHIAPGVVVLVDEGKVRALGELRILDEVVKSIATFEK